MLLGPCSDTLIPRRFSSLARPSPLCEPRSPCWTRLGASANPVNEFGIRTAIAGWRGCLVYAELYPKDDTEKLALFEVLSGVTGDDAPWQRNANANYSTEATMKRKSESGQALVLAALALVVLIGFA